MIYIADGENQRLYVKYFTTKKVIFGIGPAGTGKTCLAIDYALSTKTKNIILTRPTIEACDEHLGHLPGDPEQKLAPFVKVFDDFLREAPIGFKQNKHIERLPLAFMRGLTFNDSIIILDEAQNCTYKQLRLILTRLGETSKLVINGDPSQCDINNSGLLEVVDCISDMEEIGIVQFTNDDIKRSEFVKKLMDRLP